MTTIYRVQFGSHLYGTNTPSSDLDFKSIHLPPAPEILLQRVKDSRGHKAPKGEGQKNTSGDVDDESYSLQRYLQLLAEGQTVAIDMLFAPSPIVTSKLWQVIRNNSPRLVTKKSKAFVGYCMQQAAKYGVKGSRVAAAKAATEYFEAICNTTGMQVKVEDCLVHLTDMVKHNEHMDIVEKETTPGRSETYFVCCNRMVGFKNTVKEAYNMFYRIWSEYGERARKAETNNGIDWKALSHAVRVSEEAIELLETGTITFPLPNRAHILQIKQGMLTYKQVSTEIEHLLEKVEAASKASKLREEPDYEWIDKLVIHNYGKIVMDHVWGDLGI